MAIRIYEIWNKIGVEPILEIKIACLDMWTLIPIFLKRIPEFDIWDLEAIWNIQIFGYLKIGRKKQLEQAPIGCLPKLLFLVYMSKYPILITLFGMDLECHWNRLS